MKAKQLFIIILLAMAFSGCSKLDDWLDVKQNKNDIVPVKVADFQSLLDCTPYMNNSYPALGFAGSDNYYIADASWLESALATERNVYVWNETIFEDGYCADWNAMYRTVSYANAALDGLSKVAVTAENRDAWNNVKGGALFFRAYAFFNLAQLFTKPYDLQTAAADPGIPLRTSSDINIRYPRGTVAELYARIIADLNEAAALLPGQPSYITRPSGAAVHSLLAKVYLVMGDFEKAYAEAGDALASYSALYDFNTLSPSATRPFPALSNSPREIIFYGENLGYGITSLTLRAMVPDELYRLYNSNDLRKTLFFNVQSGNVIRFKGTYTGANTRFGGIAANEVYLIRAEAAVRTGRVEEGIASLNHLLQSRYKTATFVPYAVSDPGEALNLVLTERRKELPFTAQIRWEDLRRLNADTRFATTLSRTIAGKTYTLPPGDPRYVYPIPDDELRENALEQNIRH